MTTIPTQIGRYRVIAKLGEGGMGVVYEAIDEALNRRVALKFVRQSATADAAARQRFCREARVAASFNHPHICHIYEVAEAEEHLFIAMERLEGESLSQRLARGALPVAEGVQVALDLLDALNALHRAGFVHGDLKPSNIFLTPHGVKLLDFGLARRFVSDDATTLSGGICGTPKYMAPEQLQEGAVDGRTDLFAAGSILYEMLVGSSPFEGGSLMAIVEKILHTDPPVLGGSPIIAAADRVIHCALAKVPSRRYPNAAAMAADLRTVLLCRDEEPRKAQAVTRFIVLPFRLLRPDTEIDFLGFSLPDAITASLSSLDTLVVRSSMTAARFAAEAPDLKVIARELEVDVVLSGTVLRVGEQIRVSVQLVETREGSLKWSDTLQVSIGDLFQLQDELSRRMVELLALPLSGRERSALEHDVPATAKAYEFFLRGNQLSQDPGALDLALQMYLQAVQDDSGYAPAWARLGHVYRVIGKFRGERDMLARAESALNRALELNPDLSMAHWLCAQIEVDDGRAQDAMVRLIRRSASHSSTPELLTALVSTCRYCGLLKASLAAHDRARRLDPNVKTSVQHTLILAGEFERATVEAGGFASASAAVLALGGHPDAIQYCRKNGERLRAANMTAFATLNDELLALLDGVGDPLALEAAANGVVAGGLRDPEGFFYIGLQLAHFGRGNRAVELLSAAVDGGYFPYDAFNQLTWLEPLRQRDDFLAILRKAKHRHLQARAAFAEAGGAALLGVQE